MDPVVNHDVGAKSCASGQTTDRDLGRHGRLGHETWKIVRDSFDDETGLAKRFRSGGRTLGVSLVDRRPSARLRR